MEPAAIQHLKKLQDLLEAEKDEDYAQFKSQFLRVDVNQRRKNGLTCYPVVIISHEYTTGEYVQIDIERSSHTDTPHQFSSGKNVILFSNKNNEIQELNGTIKMVHKNSMKIVLAADDLPDWAYEGKLGVNIQFDMNSYQEMEKALEQVIQAKGNRLAELREILLGSVSPAFDVPDEGIFISGLNLSQNRAVRKALAARDVAVIHGPPGTGKTTTLVQAIRLSLQSENQVLVCAPTNTAVDLLCEKLNEQGINVLRIGHPARVSELLLSCTLDGKMEKHENFRDIKNLRKHAEEYFRMAGKYKRTFGKEEAKQRSLYYSEAKNCLREAVQLEDYISSSLLATAQVIACTPVISNSRYLRAKQFSTLFFDEASQALEPMSWIPLLKSQRVIFSGDHFQLPPLVKSKAAELGGLKETLFERFMHNHNVASLLNVQYRMHHQIMNFSNKMFYDGKLEADASVKDTLLSYHEEDYFLHHPVEFIDTAGCGFDEQQNPENLSLFNPEETGLIWKHLQLLLEEFHKYEMGNPLSIGIIAPYKEQTELLKQQLLEFDQFKREDISVKTIDGFQGEERDVIYLCFVRSNNQGEIGFLQDIRRTNVALTRARKKLVIIGDSATLAVHPFYKDLIDYCESITSYTSAWSLIHR